MAIESKQKLAFLGDPGLQLVQMEAPVRFTFVAAYWDQPVHLFVGPSSVTDARSVDAGAADGLETQLGYAWYVQAPLWSAQITDACAIFYT